MFLTRERNFEMRPPASMAFIAAFALVAVLIGGAEASDLASCTEVTDDTERLACYDLLAKESQEEVRENSADASDEAAERAKILSRCREEMGEYGSAMVKFCVEEDIAAYRALQRYAVELRPFIERCTREMGSYGWSMVKFCADEDINAERALNDLMAN